jgi:UDP-N-acetylmuramate dehydrogenase
MRQRHDVRLSELTTLRLGGPAARLVETVDGDELVEAVTGADAEGVPVLLVAGGSNLVIADHGFDGTVVRVASRGVEERSGDGDGVRLQVAAGEDWDDVVARAVAEGLAGIECLSGIPGSAGATPIQNVGAYGQEVAQTIESVRVYDRRRREHRLMPPTECGFAYRSSLFRHSEHYVVLSIALRLERAKLARPIRYAELARRLGVDPGDRAPLHEVREAVLELRRGKGMVLDARDPDSVSAGSFFVNPILAADGFAALERRVQERLGDHARPPAWPEPDGRVKTSAAWLIERAGFHKGFGDGRVGVSGKHTLALVNRGGATTAELISLARTLRDRVQDEFGVTLRPEPTLIGVSL